MTNPTPSVRPHAKCPLVVTTRPNADHERLERHAPSVVTGHLQRWRSAHVRRLLQITPKPALYLMGYFEVERAGKAEDWGDEDTRKVLRNNFHVRHHSVFKRQRAELVLVKGSGRSRLLHEAVRISVMGRNRSGQPLKVLSPQMQQGIRRLRREAQFSAQSHSKGEPRVFDTSG